MISFVGHCVAIRSDIVIGHLITFQQESVLQKVNKTLR